MFFVELKSERKAVVCGAVSRQLAQALFGSTGELAVIAYGQRVFGELRTLVSRRFLSLKTFGGGVQSMYSNLVTIFLTPMTCLAASMAAAPSFLCTSPIR